MTRAWVFMDYQNVHHSAFESFTAYGSDLKDSLIHPVSFANQVAKKRRDLEPSGIEIERVLVFRGMPNVRKEPVLNSIVTRQHNEWQRDARVDIRSRPLRYPRDWPDSKAQEKGIDVQLAVSLIHAVMSASADLYMVATRDTDLVPAIELAASIQSGAVELVSWYGQSELRVDGVTAHVLGEAAYRGSRDAHDYRGGVARRR
jgi:uncharacterized LabA/DUF88 family protein